MDDPQEGGCMCGAIRYRIDATPLWINLCYCPSCTKAAGAPVMAYARIPEAGFSITAGRPKRFASSPAVRRSFCEICGTSLFVNGTHLDEDTAVAVASLDRPDAFQPTTNVYTAGRIAWMMPLPHLKEWRGDDDRPKP